MAQSLRSRKGASEVIAAMLLIVITVAAAVLMYAYTSGLMGRLQGVAVQQPYLEQVTLDYYDWAAPSTLKLILRNVGSASVNLATGGADYFVQGVKYAPSANTCTAAQAPQTSCQVSLAATGTTGIAYTVKIATKDGAIFSYPCIAGQSTSSVP